MLVLIFSIFCFNPLGFGGVGCERREFLHGGIAAFDGEKSFLQFESLGYHVRDYVHLELRFKPDKPNGLLLYNGYRSDRSISLLFVVSGCRVMATNGPMTFAFKHGEVHL